MMDASNPFRPPARESYEDQLDLSAKLDTGEDESEDLLVDVGLTQSSSSTAAAAAEANQQPKFLESSTTSLLAAGGPIGPNKVTSNARTGGGASTTTYNANGNDNTVTSNSFTSRICGFLSVEFYRPYFDVSSATVLERMKGGMSPHKSDLFASTSSEEAASPPDLYGAVWIAFTLIFLIGATSNLNSYFAHDSQAKEPWDRDYRLLSIASTMVLVYTFLIPVIVWGASLYTGVDPRPSLIKLVGVYGYTMSIFVPASLLCVIPSVGFQWVVVLLAGAVSGVVLVRNLWTLFGQRYAALPQDVESQTAAGLSSGETPARSKSAFMLIAVAGATHAVFSLMLKLFFFQGADLAAVVEPTEGKGS